MSASTQTVSNNGKKSSNSSGVNTPASTPITNISNGQVTAQSSPPPNNNAPKYGTLVPNRIFVGGISSNTTEGELLQLFSSYGTVKAAKIIQDRAGVSKGYGFITFESEDDAKRPLREAENIVLRERKLNIAPAIKKQVSPFSRAFDASSPPAVPTGNPAQFFFPAGAMPYFQGGVYYHPPGATNPADPNNQQPTPVYQPPPVYPAQTGPPQAATYPSMMFPTQTIYMPQQYPMPIPYDYNYYQNNGASPHQYMQQQQQQHQGGGPPCPPMQPSNSPPRPPGCYGSQQMQGYGGPGDPMYYNVSVYGTAMEGAPIYSEAAPFDMAPAPPPYGPEQQELYPELDVSSSCDLNMLDGPAPVDPSATAHLMPPPHHQETNTAESATNTSPDRNSATPVVSLLSIEMQQEKDLLSMQGGRRRKTPPPQLYFQPQPPPFHHPHMIPMYAAAAPHDVYRYGPKLANGYKKPRNNNNRYKSNERTDSNSSASVVDENKNDDKYRSNVNTPPPTAYSPIANQQHYFKTTTNNTRNYHNSYRGNPRYRNTNNNNLAPPRTTLNNNPNCSEQMGTSGSFVPPSRRSRRSIRRNQSEMGQGDGPIKSADDPTTVAKKMENLKL